MYIKSNREINDGVNYKLYIMDFFVLYLDSLGLAAAKIAVLAFRVQTTPFLARQEQWKEVVFLEIQET